MNFLENLIAFVDLHLPWLLPSLEAFEQSVPPAARVLASVLLATWLVWSRQRSPVAGAWASKVARPR